MEYEEGVFGYLQQLHLQNQSEILEENSWENLVEAIQGIIGYDFRNPSLLHQAFTHYSYLDKDEPLTASYERLEYVGDAVLDLLMAKEHYFAYPDMSPGRLTKLRAANVDKEKLARVALKHEFHKFLRHKKPLLAGQIKEFEEAIVDYPMHSSGLVDAPKALGDVVEALIGAIYIDSDSLDTTWKIVKNLLQPLITPSTLHTHPVTMLYEICRKNKVKVDCRDFWKETGEIEFIVDNQFVGKAKYTGKRVVANNRAAEIAYRQIAKKLNMENNHTND